MKEKNLEKQLDQIKQFIFEYRVWLFIIVILITYSYMVLQINSLNKTQPIKSSSSQNTTLTPPIDQTTISKIQQLQNNSVSVQSLFNQARQNPFQE